MYVPTVHKASIFGHSLSPATTMGRGVFSKPSLILLDTIV